MAACLVAGLLLGLGLPPALRQLSGDPAPTAGAAANPTGTADLPGICAWRSPTPTPDPAEVRDVGTPAPNPPRTGLVTVSLRTNRGVIDIRVDLGRTPCTAASLRHLAEQGFYRQTSCHRLVDQGIFVLQCGDPTGTGRGGPAYRYADENLPVTDPQQGSPEAPAPPALSYPRGTVAMANSGAGTNGSQFFIVYRDTSLPPAYTPFGEVTNGLEVVESVAAGGQDNSNGPGDGRPRLGLVIEEVQVG